MSFAKIKPNNEGNRKKKKTKPESDVKPTEQQVYRCLDVQPSCRMLIVGLLAALL